MIVLINNKATNLRCKIISSIHNFYADTDVP